MLLFLFNYVSSMVLKVIYKKNTVNYSFNIKVNNCFITSFLSFISPLFASLGLNFPKVFMFFTSILL